ncbi:DUF924 family protein [Woeseia oceani]|uniref:DUF924 domain-containing protein n=1 Tax=Woeseia oceani TaxID=1548547 RepID=A0A193LJ77_9GAMM|nr:DUF924 family protein [Woeseia oceani]ANO52562.1 hypothetical protein BA177_16440 [Woeseia oceani]
MNETTAADVLKFWFDDIEKVRWFKSDPDFDRELEERFGALLAAARNGELTDWCETASGYLALIIVLDQFSRNIFRGRADAFAADDQALQLTLDGIDKGIDEELTLEQRSFFYLPLRHAEDLVMQQLGLRKTRELNAAGYGSDKYALNHLQLIERFGRFPHRNRVLGRADTIEEAQYLADGSAGF